MNKSIYAKKVRIFWACCVESVKSTYILHLQLDFFTLHSQVNWDTLSL
jgi:hypothetical protein